MYKTKTKISVFCPLHGGRNQEENPVQSGHKTSTTSCEWDLDVAGRALSGNWVGWNLRPPTLSPLTLPPLSKASL